MADVAEVLASLGSLVSTDDGDVDDEKLKQVVQQLRQHDSPTVKAIAQRLLNAGAGRSKGEADKTIKKLEHDLETVTGERDGLQEKLDAAASKPHEQQAAWDKERDKLTKKAQTAEEALKAERDGRKGDRVATKAALVVGTLKGSVDEDYLEEVLTPRIQKRIRPTDDGVELLDEDESPLDGDEKAQVASLGASILKVVPDKYRLRDMVPGGGGGGRGGKGTVTVEQLQQEKAASGQYRM